MFRHGGLRHLPVGDLMAKKQVTFNDVKPLFAVAGGVCGFVIGFELSDQALNWKPGQNIPPIDDDWKQVWENFKTLLGGDIPENTLYEKAYKFTGGHADPFSQVGDYIGRSLKRGHFW